MKYLPLLLALFLTGCACVWTNDVFILTFMKNYNLRDMTSTSQTIKVKAIIKPVPEIEIETNQ